MAERAALYDRLSDETQRANFSLATQEAQQYAYCNDKGYIVNQEHVYIEVKTGVDSWRFRPVLQQLLAAARNHEFSVLVVYHTDRLARGDDLIVLWHELLYYGVRIESVSQNLENTPEGKIMLHIFSITSSLEHQRFMTRATDNKRMSVIQGNLLGAKPAYGWAWENPTRRTKDQRDSRNRLIPNPEVFYDSFGVSWTEPQVINAMYRMVDSGKTIYQIQNWLRQYGIKTREGCEVWQSSTISRYLRKREYVSGEMVVFKRGYTREYDGSGKLHKHYFERPDEETIKIPVPPLLLDENDEPDVALWERVQEKLARNQAEAYRRNPNAEDALLRAGFIFCGYCGNRMIAHHNNQGGVDYLCRRGAQLKTCKHVSISGNIVDKAAWEKVCRVIRNPSELEAMLREMQSDEPETPGEEGIKARLAEIELEIENVMDMGRTARSDTAKAKAKFDLAQLEEEQKNLLRNKNLLTLLQGKWELAQEEVKKFEGWCEEFRDKLETASYQQKRDALLKLGLRVTVWKYENRRRRYRVTLSPPKILDIVRQVSWYAQNNVTFFWCFDEET